jgi:hypothetical protein
MNQDSGWRKRQIALDAKAENARELGLDYEPDKREHMKEALKLALEALEGVLDDSPKVLDASISGGLYEVVQCRDAITAIKEALAQPEQELVVCTHEWVDDTKLKPQWRCIKCGAEYTKEKA